MTLDESGALFRAFQVADVPTVLIADARGTLVRRIAADDPADLREALEALRH